MSETPGSQANEEMYGKYYDKPSWWFRFRYDTQVKRKTVLHLLGTGVQHYAGARILEIGFGSGAVLFSFPKTCELIGLEISQSAICAARRHAEQLGYRKHTFVLATEKGIPCADSSIDLVVASHVLEHVDDDAALLEECHRVLRPGSRAVVLVPINENYADPKHLRNYTRSILTTRAVGAGFYVAETLENEMLFHLVEKFYFSGGPQQRGLSGKVIAALFNVPTAVLPFSAYRMIDHGMRKLGYKPRQLAAALVKAA